MNMCKNVVADKNMRREQLRGLMERADAARVDGFGEGEIAENLMKSGRRWSWVIAKLFDALPAVLSCFMTLPKNDIDGIGCYLTSLMYFLPLEDFLAISDAIDDIKAARRDVLVRIHDAGGIDAIDHAHPLMAEYIKINEQAKAMVEQVEALYHNTVVFRNI